MQTNRPHRTMLGACAAVLALAGLPPALAAGADDDLVGRIAGEGGVFDFTKLGVAGDPLPDQAAIYTITPWNCVRDEITGLEWEVKTIDGALRDQNHTYTWYNPDSETNGGAPGRADGGQCTGSDCDVNAYVKAVNQQGLCGHNDWRLPTRAELRTIVDYQSSFPAIDTSYFPNTVARSFWSAEPNDTYPRFAWHTDFKFGLASYYYLKSGPKAVRLVRGGK